MTHSLCTFPHFFSSLDRFALKEEGKIQPWDPFE